MKKIIALITLKKTVIDKNNNFNFEFKWHNWEKEFYGKKVLIKDNEKISFSRIVFDEKQQEAIMFLELVLENTGYGKMYLLKKK